MTPVMHKGLRGYKDSQGKWVPAVGTVLDVLCGAKSDWINEAALAEGSACHAAIAQYLTERTLTGVSEARQTRVMPLIHWLAKEGFKPVAAESTCFSSRYGYAGTLDAILVREDGLYVADWKFAESLDLPRYTVQLTAYSKIVEKVKGTLLVQITKAGEVKPRFRKPCPASWSAFLGALGVVKWRIAN